MHDTMCECETCSGQRFDVMPFEAPGLFSEAEEEALAMELLSVASEEELDRFLGSVFSGVWKGLKKVGSAVANVAKPLGSVLKGVAKQALPFVGGALGSFIPIPGVGTMIGRTIGSMAANALEMETAGMAPSQRDMAMARRFVRIAGTAAQQAAQASPGTTPQATAYLAARDAVRYHLPEPVVGRWRRRRQGGIVVDL
ncbi:MAG: hypothetical protein V4463_13140 [Pseudomonadota bacterium]